jgi:hypothetical protein
MAQKWLSERLFGHTTEAVRVGKFQIVNALRLEPAIGFERMTC